MRILPRSLVRTYTPPDQQILVPIVIVTACCGPWRATQHFSCEPVEVDDNSLGRRGRGSVASVCGKGWITRAEHESNGGAHFLKIESALLECTSFANCGELRRIHMQRAASTVTPSTSRLIRAQPAAFSHATVTATATAAR
eukprot:scaffold123972_cov63-Phaeocystis_antarctica.AAC.1